MKAMSARKDKMPDKDFPQNMAAPREIARPKNNPSGKASE